VLQVKFELVANFKKMQYNCNLVASTLQSSEAHTEAGQTLGFLVPKSDVL